MRVPLRLRQRAEAWEGVEGFEKLLGQARVGRDEALKLSFKRVREPVVLDQQKKSLNFDTVIPSPSHHSLLRIGSWHCNGYSYAHQRNGALGAQGLSLADSERRSVGISSHIEFPTSSENSVLSGKDLGIRQGTNKEAFLTAANVTNRIVENKSPMAPCP